MPAGTWDLWLSELFFLKATITSDARPVCVKTGSDVFAGFTPATPHRPDDLSSFCLTKLNLKQTYREDVSSTSFTEDKS